MATLAQRLKEAFQSVAADMKGAMRKSVYDADGDGVVDVAKAVAWAGVTGAPAIPEKLTAARTYYVRADGNDANTGMGDSAAEAFKTIAVAVSKVAALDCGNFRATVSVGPGTFQASVSLPVTTGAAVPLLKGAGPTTIISASFSNWPCISVLRGASWEISSLQVAGRAANGIGVLMFGSAQIGGITFGSGIATHLAADRNGFLYAIGLFTIAAGAGFFASVAARGVIDLRQANVTLTGSPAFTSAFVNADSAGTVLAYGAVFNGSATGKRYQATSGGGIAVGGAAVTFFPGSVAGTVATSGWYG